MGTLGGGGLWWRFPSCGGGGGDRHRRRRGHRRPGSSSSESIGFGREGRPLFDFPLKQATIAASLTLTGDTVAQVRDRLVSYFHGERDEENKELISVLLLNHDWLRALRMASYGFLLYGYIKQICTWSMRYCRIFAWIIYGWKICSYIQISEGCLPLYCLDSDFGFPFPS
ncbi:hypothetical protein ACMD2_06488 [Ananas comosus]|uniref:Uncharacterized protein n=1 Tax=Ananas comosus TaxID=4615 RepID=A0A199UDT4_ANACO|nr:hypothetical protein ACMD2_06488 [Ananas comosus]